MEFYNHGCATKQYGGGEAYKHFARKWTPAVNNPQIKTRKTVVAGMYYFILWTFIRFESSSIKNPVTKVSCLNMKFFSNFYY